jgi:gliding motility-associated-like protein
MKYALLTFLIFFSINQSAFGQTCYVTVTPEDTLICPGESVEITAIANLIPSGQSFNFNRGVLPTGWNAVGGNTFSIPCAPSLTGDPYYWASTASVGTYPGITTATFDVSCGGTIVFDMLYAVQTSNIPCEGPDLADEGVELQYSTTGGAPWTSIVYYSPGGYELPTNPNTTAQVATTAGTPYTTWNTFTVPIPIGAMTTSTAFRWTQEQNSGTCCDNWGLDNIIINSSGTPCGSAVVNWSNGLADTNTFIVNPMNNDTLIAYVYDSLGIYQCESTPIFISVFPDDIEYNLIDTIFALCPNDSFPVEVLNIENGTMPYSFDWSTGGTNSMEILSSGSNEQGVITYFVDVSDDCGYIHPDTVVMITNQILSIDSVFSYPASACENNGAVVAYPINGITNELNQPFFNWSGPGLPAGGFDGTSTLPILSSGWYYFSVIDDVCNDFDSVFVELNDPPIADFSASASSGCSPVDITFTNNSENTTTYYWNFNNGNDYTVDNLDNQDQTFTNASTVMLVASTDPNCADTAYLNINVAPCGCTDPTATNYNSSAIQDDGSCTFPVPTVFVPNVITPNGDGNNDLFELTYTNATSIELTILNRWGNVMYNAVHNFGSTSNPDWWDGMSPNGKDAEDGTYFFRYIVNGIDETLTIEGQGFLQLIR